MKWKNMTFGKKIAIGFGVVLILLTVVGLLSYTGVGRIVNNAGQVIDGNKLDGVLAQKEVDHLNWVAKVNALLTDTHVTNLEVETDYHKCGFGKWLYGEGRQTAEKLVPSVAPLLKEIEGPHQKLHESAITIGKVFKQADTKLPTKLTERVVDHLKWAAKIREAFIQHRDSLNVQTDPTKCALGKWLLSEEARKTYQSGDTDFKRVWDEMVAVHKKLHESAVGIEKHLAYERLTQLKGVKKDLGTEFEKISTALFAALEKGMEQVIDPAKNKAEQAGDIVSMARWSGIDMVMNEGIIHPFNEARLAMARFEAERTTATWTDYEEKVKALQTGLNSWLKLVKGEPALEKTVDSLTALIQVWGRNAGAYRKAIQVLITRLFPLRSKVVF